MISLFEHMAVLSPEERGENRSQAANEYWRLAQVSVPVIEQAHDSQPESYQLLLRRYSIFVRLADVADARLVAQPLVKVQNRLADAERKMTLLQETGKKANWPEHMKRLFWQESLNQLRLEDQRNLFEEIMSWTKSPPEKVL